ncbi:MAG: Inorganic pyrophosphatase [Chlamydiales bacterium]|nr:Inorganic pyrophosphatase [Chlamydiales bacterium]MCH9619887.1 Inorganic pyrophosphatase [Chlamydiales bacterium]MCH9622686.1 Inorganic pyrophosphatase [Chlamydiales bacterium]
MLRGMKDQPIWNLMNLFCRAHPWHGVDIGENAPEEIHCYVEIVPTDTVKFELDKSTGLLKADRPQKYSNYCPALYGLIPQTHAGKRVGEYCSKKSKRKDIQGDDDPLDICILTEKPFLRGDLLVTAIPIGGFRAIDKNEADDKIIAVLKGDLIYGDIKNLKDCPANLIDRLQHYFLTYKESPADLGGEERRLEIDAVYDRKEALEVIKLGQQDYQDHFSGIRDFLKSTFSDK